LRKVVKGILNLFEKVAIKIIKPARPSLAA